MALHTTLFSSFLVWSGLGLPFFFLRSPYTPCNNGLSFNLWGGRPPSHTFSGFPCIFFLCLPNLQLNEALLGVSCLRLLYTIKLVKIYYGRHVFFLSLYTWDEFCIRGMIFLWVIRVVFVHRLLSLSASVSVSLPAELSHLTGFIFFTYMISCDLCFYACFLFLFFSWAFLIPSYQSLLAQERTLSVLENWDGYLFCSGGAQFLFFEISSRIFQLGMFCTFLYFFFFLHV